MPELFGNGIESVPAMLTPGEGIFTTPQTDAYIAHSQALDAGFSGHAPQQITVNNYIDGQQLDARTEVIVDSRLVQVGSELVTAMAQS